MSYARHLANLAGAAAIAALLLAAPHLYSVPVFELNAEPKATAQPLPAAPAHATQGTTPPANTGMPCPAAAAKGVAQLHTQSANSTQPAASYWGRAAGAQQGDQPCA